MTVPAPFVGRHEQLNVFRRALSGDDTAPAVLYVHGPGGIGKSALLRRFAEQARRAGRAAIMVDCRGIDASPAALEAAAGEALHDPDAVLLVDTFEHCRGLEGWLREQFLPRLPARVITVLAAREAPDPGWVVSPGWRELLYISRLRNLRPQEAADLLRQRQVPQALHHPVLEFTGGHPLALTLAASVARSATTGEDAEVATWKPGLDVTEQLLPRLIGDVPSALHRRALEVCAMAQVTSEALLREVFGGDAEALFDWLRRLPFLQSTEGGVQPYDVVRETLDRHLRTQDPATYERLHAVLHRHLLQRIRAASPSQVTAAVGAFLFLVRHNGPMSAYHTWSPDAGVQETALRPGDAAAVLALATQAEGPESAVIAEHWLRRQPEAFRIYRHARTGTPIAFSAWLALRDGEGCDVDPVVAAAWEHARATAAPRDGEHLGINRFAVHPQRYQRSSPVMDGIQWRAVAEIVRSPGLAWSYVVMHDDGHWDEQLVHFDMSPIAARPAVNGRRYALFAHDWRAMPVELWLGRHRHAALQDDPGLGPQLDVLTRPQFDQAVRDALRHLRRPADLAANPLHRSKLVAEHGGDLAALLRREIKALPEGRGGDKLRRALAETFLHGAPTQEAAAARLRLPFSTYRRHLRTGVQRISDALWQRELRL